MLKLMMITNAVPIAREALAAGVDRIFIDLERVGKGDRQGHLDTHRTDHSLQDVRRIRDGVPDAELLVRTNPVYDGISEEVEAVLDAGADIVMLPMCRTVRELEAFVSMVNGRAVVNLLLETPQALARLSSMIEVLPEGSEVHVGLNDLHLGMGLTFMFELVAGGLVDHVARMVRERGLRFGFGGIARVGDGALPAQLVVGEHVRLGSEMVILSRAFRGYAKNVEELRASLDLRVEVEKLRVCERAFRAASPEELEENRQRVRAGVQTVVELLLSRGR